MLARVWLAAVLGVFLAASPGAALGGAAVSGHDDELAAAITLCDAALGDAGAPPKARKFLEKAKAGFAAARSELAGHDLATSFTRTKEGLNKLLGAALAQPSLNASVQASARRLIETSRALLRAALDEATLLPAPAQTLVAAEKLYDKVLDSIAGGFVGGIFTRMKKTASKVAKYVQFQA